MHQIALLSRRLCQPAAASAAAFAVVLAAAVALAPPAAAAAVPPTLGKLISVDAFGPPTGHAVYSHDNALGYFAVSPSPGGPGRVNVFVVATTAMYSVWTTGVNPGQVVMSPNGTYLYVPNQGGATVTAINRKTGVGLGTIAVGGVPDAVAFSVDSATAYVANRAGGTVSVINTTTRKVTGTVIVGGSPTREVPSADGTRIYVLTTNGIAVINTATNTLSGVRTLPGPADQLALVSGGAKLYAMDSATGTWAVIDTATLALVSVTSAGQRADGLAVAADGATAYVADGQQNVIHVIAAVNDHIVRTIAAPDFVSLRGTQSAVGKNGARLYLTASENDANGGDGVVLAVDPVAGVVTDVVSADSNVAYISANPWGVVHVLDTGIRGAGGALVVIGPLSGPGPTVTLQPVRRIDALAGTSVVLHAAAYGNPAPTVQWQRSVDGTTYTTIPGATSTTYATPTLTAASGSGLYRAVFANRAGSATTTPASIAVRAATTPIFAMSAGP